MSRTVFLDIETGGLKLEEPIIQIAAVAVDRHLTELEAREWKLQFDVARSDPKALQVNHYTREGWEKALAPAQAVEELCQMLNAYCDVPLTSSRSGKPYNVCRVGGHNIAGFDIPRLSRLFKLHDTFFPIHFAGALDTLQGAVWYFARTGEKPPDSFSLQTLAKHFSIVVDQSHEALADVRTSIQLARRLLA